MWSVLSRCSEASHDSMMCLRERPRLFGFGPVGQKTLVKISIESRLTPLECPSEHLLGAADPVDVGGVEGGHARVERRVHALDRRVVSDLARMGDPVPVRDRRDHHAAASKMPMLHGAASYLAAT